MDPGGLLGSLAVWAQIVLKTLLRSSCSLLSWAETDKTVGSSMTSVSTAPSLSSPTSPTSDAAASLEMNNPHAIPRRHAPIEQLARQGSFRGFPALSQKMSPFKRQLSLRINELPSTMQRKTDFPIKNAGNEASDWFPYVLQHWRTVLFFNGDTNLIKEPPLSEAGRQFYLVSISHWKKTKAKVDDSLVSFQQID